ncbi:MAG: tetratricopeptide repeat protein [Candidatus Lokiarchaeota archaeon]|nr:tetratricopeptide repeat protein [Candidatus Lokiarchaeota archaeon]
MKQPELDLEKILESDESLTFLAGAGISIDPPSNLPSARRIMRDIIRFSCVDESLEDLLSDESINNMQFESILQIFQEIIDPELKIMEYYGKAKSPNVIHHFLVDMMLKGHIVMTTNFDYLIEYALIEADNNAEAVITKDDYLNHKDPVKLVNKGKLVLYKLHGSKKNIFTGEDTKESIISTIDAFAREKKEDVFSLPQYELELFQNACKDRILITLGYSGGDVFDVIPTIRKMKDLKGVVWIQHSENEEAHIYNSDSYDELLKTSKGVTNHLDRLLYRLHNSLGIKTIKIAGNTSKLLPIHNKIQRDSHINHIKSTPKVKTLLKWLQTNLSEPSKPYKQYMSSIIYKFENNVQNALKYAKKALETFENIKNETMTAHTLQNIGNYYFQLGAPQKALENYIKSYVIFDKNHDKLGSAGSLSYIAMIYYETGKAKQAIENYKKSYEIHKGIRNLKGMSNTIGQLGLIYLDFGMLSKSLEFIKEAYNIDKKINNLDGMAYHLGILGLVYRRLGQFQKALEYHKNSFDVYKNLNNQQGMAAHLGNMGNIYIIIGKLDKALEHHKRAYEIHKKLQYIKGMAENLGNIGINYIRLGKLKKALEYLERCYELYKELDNTNQMATALTNMAIILSDLNNPKKALEYSQKAHDIYTKFNNLHGIGAILKTMGYIYVNNGNDQTGLEYYEKACETYEKIKEINEMAVIKAKIANLYEKQQKWEKALSYSQKAYKLYDKTGNRHEVVTMLNRMGLFELKLEKKTEAIKHFEEMLKRSREIQYKKGVELAENLLKEVREQ